MYTKNLVLLTLFLIILFPINLFANCQGCCSSHGGVVCSGGVTKCNDGTPLSSNCFTKGCNVCDDTDDTAVPTPIPQPSPTGETKIIKLGSFNIQTFGKNKADNPLVMDILTETISRFDIIAIQEIKDSSGTAIVDLVNAIDLLGVDYEVIIGPRLGRTSAYKEQYAFIYRTSTIIHGKSYTFDDTKLELFHREPFISSFSTVNSDFDFVLITIHTDPDEATEEINALPFVVDDVRAHFPGEQNIILLGDLNADCSYFDEDDMNCPLRDASYRWLISNSMDTNIAESSCTYDRIIITKELDDISIKRAGVFRFNDVFALTDNDARNVSDHYPVWVDFTVTVSSSINGSTNENSSSDGCFIGSVTNPNSCFYLNSGLW